MTTQAIETPALGKTTAKNVGLWTLQIAAAAMFLMAGYGKLSSSPDMVGLFNAIGMGQWFRYLTGTIEVTSAVLLLVPSLSGVGALILVPTMIGALITHAKIGGNPSAALVLLAATGIVAYGRRIRTLRLIKR